MSSNDEQGDFASFMASGASAPTAVSEGETVRGTVTQIAGDSVFVDLGTRAEGRVPRAQLELASGQLKVKVGDPLEATVVARVDPGGGGGPLLAVQLGRDQRVDLSALELALTSQTPVVGRAARAVKGGLEVELGGVRAFCPASQVDRSYVADLTAFVGQELSFLVSEIRDEGRSVVLSRRRALERERAEAATAARERLAVGQELAGTVTSIQKYGAFVDLGGVEGLVHISELSGTRVPHVEDVVSVGEQVQVRVLAIEADAGDDKPGRANRPDRGPRIRLSMKALSDAAGPEARSAPRRDQVLAAKVVRLLPHGLIVSTPSGDGFVPKRELSLPPGADHRRAFSVDQALEVVVLDGTGDRMRFSVARVDDVRAGQDYRDYRERAPIAEGGGLGSMAALLSGIDSKGLPPGPRTPRKGASHAKAAPAPTGGVTRAAPQAAGRGGASAEPASAVAEVHAASSAQSPSGHDHVSDAAPAAPDDSPPSGSQRPPAQRRRIVSTRNRKPG